MVTFKILFNWFSRLKNDFENQNFLTIEEVAHNFGSLTWGREKIMIFARCICVFITNLKKKSWNVSNLDVAIGVWRMEANSCTKIGIWETWPFEKIHLVFHQEFDLVNHLCFILNFSYIFQKYLPSSSINNWISNGYLQSVFFIFIKNSTFSENSMN